MAHTYSYSPGWLSLREVCWLIEQLKNNNIQFVFYGGAIRDALSGKIVNDIDILAVTEMGYLIEIAKAHSLPYTQKGESKIVIQVGTIEFDINILQFTYTDDGALSEAFLRDKMLATDFTMNSLCLTPDGVVIDFFNGSKDIKSGIVRWILDPFYVVCPDRLPSKIARYFYYFSESSEANIDAYALTACGQHAAALKDKPLDAVAQLSSILGKILLSSRPQQVCEYMRQSDVLSLLTGLTIHSLNNFNCAIAYEKNLTTYHKGLLRLFALLMSSDLPLAHAVETISLRLKINNMSLMSSLGYLKLLASLDQTLPKKYWQLLVEELDKELLETLIVLRCMQDKSHKDIARLHIQYLHIIQSCTAYNSSNLAPLYLVIRQGAAPYTLRHHYGFTLIELTISMVIIGFIVGGVLVGRDLIRASEVRSYISQLEKINVAANTFISKYGCLPGDCNDATLKKFGLTTTNIPYSGSCYVNNTVVNNNPGDNNSIIGESVLEVNNITPGTSVYNCGDVEIALFWQHLINAKLFNETMTDVFFGQLYGGSLTDKAMLPKIKFNAVSPNLPGNTGITIFPGVRTSVSGINTFMGSHLFFVTSLIGAPSDGSAILPGAAVFPPIVAQQIDKKIDDGYPTSGSTIAISDDMFFGSPTPATSGVGQCMNSSSPPGYNISTTSPSANCGVAIKAAF